jgi:hypothetical protein
MPEPSQQPLFDGGMVLRRDLGPNAGLGIGLLSMSAGRKGANLRSDGARRSRKPAISFSFKF